jgi:hypothetical protein
MYDAPLLEAPFIRHINLPRPDAPPVSLGNVHLG